MFGSVLIANRGEIAVHQVLMQDAGFLAGGFDIHRLERRLADGLMAAGAA